MSSETQGYLSHNLLHPAALLYVGRGPLAVHHAPSCVHPLGAALVHYTVVAPRIAVIHAALVYKRYRGKAPVRVWPYPRPVRDGPLWQPALVVVQQQERVYLLYLLRREGLPHGHPAHIHYVGMQQATHSSVFMASGCLVHIIFTKINTI